jgi:predicted phosphodiesterase
MATRKIKNESASNDRGVTLTQKRAQEVSKYALEHSKTDAAEVFGISVATVERYMRHCAVGSVNIGDNTIMSKIRERYTDQELKMLAKGGKLLDRNLNTPRIDFEGKHIKIGGFSDTHLGSMYTEDWMIEKMFDEFEKEKIDFATCAGDVTEGMSNRQGHVFECSEIGFANQKRKAIELFKECPSPLYLISGNHDRWYIKNSGGDMVEDICDALPNATFLGHDEGSIDLKGKAELRLWHGEDGNCFDDQTEILTDHGFIPFHQLTVDTQVATMSKDTHAFEWQYPTEITDQHYVGDMIHFKSRVVDSMVTPNHGMWTRANKGIAKHKKQLTHPTKSHMSSNYDWHRKDAVELLNDHRRQKWQFTTVTEDYHNSLDDKVIDIPHRESRNKGVKVHHFNSLRIEDIAELIAWYVTEGYANANKGNITICQDSIANPGHHNQILELLKRIGAEFRVCGKNAKDIIFGSMEMAEYLHGECGHLSRSKHLPYWLKNQPSQILKIVFDTMIKGDGWVHGKGYGYKSISPQLLNDFAEIAIKLGYGVTFNKDTVTVRCVENYPSSTNKPQKVQYDGRIYCCSVPNGLICVRRNGKVLWTHNSYATSYRIQKVVESLTGGDKPNVMFFGHTHKQIHMYERMVHCYSMGSIQKQSKWMRSKRIAAHTGFWIIDIWVNDNGVAKIGGVWHPFYQ